MKCIKYKLIGLHIQTSKFPLKRNQRPKQWYLKGTRIWQFFHYFSNISPHSKGDYLVSGFNKNKKHYLHLFLTKNLYIVSYILCQIKIHKPSTCKATIWVYEIYSVSTYRRIYAWSTRVVHQTHIWEYNKCLSLFLW